MSENVRFSRVLKMGGSSIHGGNTNSGAMITDRFGGGKAMKKQGLKRKS